MPLPTLPRLRRPSLSTQVFLAVLATAALVALAMGAAARWSFQRGFLGYLDAQAVQRMEVVVPRLAEAYLVYGSWEFVRGRSEVWFDLIGVGPHHPAGREAARMDAEQAAQGLTPPVATPAVAPVPTQRNPDDPPPLTVTQRRLVDTDLLGAARRLSLRDAEQRHVMGFPGRPEGSVQRPISVGDRVVGWLGIAPLQTFTDAAALEFLEQQRRASLAMGALAVALAAAVAVWVARTLLAPVRRVAVATHQLAAGAFDTRVPEGGHGEVAQLAQDFNQLALTLERNERVRREYMADVSHELRTPLAVLRGELEAIEDGVHAPTPELIQALQQQVATLSQLVGDLHELALADVGALSYRKAALDLAAVLHDAATVLRLRAGERGLEVDVQAPAAPVIVHGDAERLRQLLHNLFSNSVRYTDAGGRIQVQLQANGDEAVLDVQDSAPGVPEKHLPRLFDRFYRVEASRDRARGGSGLGLAICRSIVEAHGGLIEATASPLGGLWLRVRLPRLLVSPAAVGPR